MPENHRDRRTRPGPGAAHREDGPFAGSIRTHRQAQDILDNPALTVYDNPHAFLMCVYNRDRALCHRLDITDAPSLERCRPSCVNIARTDRYADELLQRAQALEEQAASETVPGLLVDRLTQHAARSPACRTGAGSAR